VLGALNSRRIYSPTQHPSSTGLFSLILSIVNLWIACERPTLRSPANRAAFKQRS